MTQESTKTGEDGRGAPAVATAPDVSSLAKNTVTFSEGRSLRQGEASANALAAASAQLSAAVASVLAPPQTPLSAPPMPGAVPAPETPVYITSDPDLLSRLVTYRRILDEAAVLTRNLDAVRDRVEDALAAAADGQEPTPSLFQKYFAAPAASGGAELALALAGVAGTAIGEAASLFELDVHAQTSVADIAASTVHAAAIPLLLAAVPGREFRHETARTMSFEQSHVLSAIADVIDDDVALAGLAKRLELAMTKLGDPGGMATAARTALAKARTDGNAERAREAETAWEQARSAAKRLQELTDAKAVLEGTVGKAAGFAAHVSGTPAGGGSSPLSIAVSVEALAQAAVTGGSERSEAATAELIEAAETARQLANDLTVAAEQLPEDTPDGVRGLVLEAAERARESASQKAAEAEKARAAAVQPFVLAISGAVSESSQIVVTRRLFAPRIQTTVSVGFDYVLTRGERLYIAGRAVGSETHHGRITRRGAKWKRLRPLSSR